MFSIDCGLDDNSHNTNVGEVYIESIQWSQDALEATIITYIEAWSIL